MAPFDETINSTSESSEKAKTKKFRYSIEDSLSSGPVLNATNSMNPVFLRTYVADVVLCREDEHLLELFRSEQRMRAKVRFLSNGIVTAPTVAQCDDVAFVRTDS